MKIPKIGDFNYDPNNITGKQLAEIGRWALTGKKMVEERMKEEYTLFQRELIKLGKKEGETITDLNWLDARINEVCNKGRGL